MHSRRHPLPLALALALSLSGCGYVHVGRLPAPATVVGDDQLRRENSELQRERKLLERELALTRAQGDALRRALESRAADGPTSRRLLDQLAAATRELAELQQRHAALQEEKNVPAATVAEATALKARLAATEEQLASALRDHTQLQREIARLRGEVERTRADNVALSDRVRAVTADHERAQAALVQLNTDLLAEKHARARAEHEAETLRAHLQGAAPGSALAQQRTGAAPAAHALAPAPGRPESAGGVTAALVSTAGTRARASIERDVPGGPVRLHVIAGGDTLARISTRYYGTPARWGDILAANRDLLGDAGSLIIGRTLRIP